jgi:anthranilate phosphoribosyltransferase
VLLNSAAALVALSPGDGPLADQLREGMAKAAEAIDSGAAKRTLDRWVAVSNG